MKKKITFRIVILDPQKSVEFPLGTCLSKFPLPCYSKFNICTADFIKPIIPCYTKFNNPFIFGKGCNCDCVDCRCDCDDCRCDCNHCRCDCDFCVCDSKGTYGPNAKDLPELSETSFQTFFMINKS